MVTIEIPLKLKHRVRKPGSRGGRGNYGGNNRASAGKHTAHPDIHGYRVKGYKCEPKWNPKPAESND